MCIRDSLRTEGSRRRTTYIPAISRDAYREFHAKEILEDAYDNSLVKFVTAYAKRDNITKEDADAIIAILNDTVK